MLPQPQVRIEVQSSVDVCVAIFLSLLAGLVLLGAFGFTAGRVREACCAKCRYLVRGLPGAVCPECGHNLRDGGTRQPGARILVRPSMGIQVLCRIVLVAGPALVLLAGSQKFVEYRTSSASAHAKSASSLFLGVDAHGQGSLVVTSGQSISNYAIPCVPCHATMYGSARTVHLRILDTSLRAEYDSPDGHRKFTQQALTPIDVLNWMVASGTLPSSATAEAEAKGVHQLLVNLAVGGGEVDDPGVGVFAALAKPTITGNDTRGAHPLVQLGILGMGALVLVALLRPLLASHGVRE